MSKKRGRCSVCEYSVKLNKKDLIQRHSTLYPLDSWTVSCPGSGLEPKAAEPQNAA